MAAVVIYDPGDPVVANRVTQYLQSANTPDYSGNANTLINPDLAAVVGVPVQFWKFDGVADIVPMSAPEQNLISFIPASTFYDSMDSQLSTTALTYQNAITSQVPLKANVTYRVVWTYEFETTLYRNIKIRTTLDGTVIGETNEISDIFGTAPKFSTGAGIYEYTPSTTGDKTFVLDYSATNASYAVKIRRVRLKVEEK